MTRTRAALIAMLLSSAMALPAAAKPFCYKPSESRAVQFRQLQVELMVAALKCRPVDAAFQDKYSAYVGKVSTQLNHNARELRGLFARQGKSSSHMDRFMTSLSNEASMRSLESADYCATQAATFDRLLGMAPADIETFAAETMAAPTDSPSCVAVRQAKAAKTPEIKVKARVSEKDG